MRIILFGADVAGQHALRRLSNRVEVVAVADNDPRKHGTSFMGYPVIAAGDIRSTPYDCIVVASTYEQEIERQLLDLGVSAADIEFPPPVSGARSWSAALLRGAAMALAGTALYVLFW